MLFGKMGIKKKMADRVWEGDRIDYLKFLDFDNLGGKGRAVEAEED